MALKFHEDSMAQGFSSSGPGSSSREEAVVHVVAIAVSLVILPNEARLCRWLPYQKAYLLVQLILLQLDTLGLQNWESTFQLGHKSQITVKQLLEYVFLS